MPARDLKEDIKANIGELAALLERKTARNDGIAEDPIPVTPTEIALHLKNSLWPFLDGVADHMGEYETAFTNADDAIEGLEDAVDELTEQSGTVITKDDAGVLATVILLARELAKLYEAGKTPSADQVNGLKLACAAAEKVIHENTIDVDLDGDEDDDEGDEDDDD